MGTVSQSFLGILGPFILVLADAVRLLNLIAAHSVGIPRIYGSSVLGGVQIYPDTRI